MNAKKEDCISAIKRATDFMGTWNTSNDVAGALAKTAVKTCVTAVERYFDSLAEADEPTHDLLTACRGYVAMLEKEIDENPDDAELLSDPLAYARAAVKKAEAANG